MIKDRNILNPELKQLCEKFFKESTAFFNKETLPEKYERLHPANQYIDQTLLKPETTLEQIENLCTEARTHNFRSVCVQPHYVNKAKELLRGTNVMPITVVGFPLGANTTSTKIYETQVAIILGAKEIDMVINIGAMKSGEYDFVCQDIKDVVQAAQGVPVKVIIETAYLNVEEKIIASACVQLSGAKYIKTSTGFAPTQALIEDVQLFKHLLKGKVKIKASGGIKTKAQAKAFIEAGADRLGTSSGVAIIKGTSAAAGESY
jgi:deoxyribose-phosphate aldolase